MSLRTGTAVGRALRVAGLPLQLVGAFLCLAAVAAANPPPATAGTAPPPRSGGTSVQHVASGARPSPVKAFASALAGNAARTTFTLDLSSGVRAEVFSLADPYRVVVDLPDVSFHLPAGNGRKGNGLVSAYRYGLFAEGKARIVIDTRGPVRIDKAAMENLAGGRGVRLAIELVPTDKASFGSGTGPASTAPQDATVHRSDDGAKPRGPAHKPVVVIDPGHGGIDPGTIGASNVTEKSVALAVALQLRRELARSGRYDVKLTRTSDVFVALDKRLRMSRDWGADLFISIHADAIAERQFAEVIRGATVYTLSERASDEQARLMAEKENASDLIAGLDARENEDLDEVKNILFDLMRRETANFSSELSKQLVSSLKKSVSLSRDPQRSAAFKVLKQTHSPSVLIELGYMSHPEDEKLMVTTDWQRQVAQSIASAVDAYFNRRMANRP